jgi:glycosyltransferase involved in cell wall biosynthesis
MRLLINAVGLRAGGGLTVGLNCLRGIRHARPDYEIKALVPAKTGYEELCSTLSIPCETFTKGPFYPAWRVWFDQVQVPRLSRQWSADVVFALNNQAAWGVSCAQAVLFHNPYFIYPAADWPPLLTRFERLSLLLQRRLFASTAPRCASVIAQTTVAAKRLETQYGITPSRLAVVPNVVAAAHDGAETRRGALLAAGMREAAAGRVSALTLARYYPHKQLEFILRVAGRLRDLNDRRFVFFITIAADQHRGARALLERIEAERLERDIVNIGPVGHEELRSAYAAADVCFLPTSLESMSGSYVEARHYQRPVVTTERDFAREVCGDAAHYFAAGDVEGAITQLRTAAVMPRYLEAPAPAHRPWLDLGRDLAEIIDSIGISRGSPGREHACRQVHGEQGCSCIRQQHALRDTSDPAPGAKHWQHDEQGR